MTEKAHKYVESLLTRKNIPEIGSLATEQAFDAAINEL